MKTVNLYTRQHENSYHELMTKGIITNKEIYIELHMKDIAPFFKKKYTKFVEMAEKRVARPNTSYYPLWCSVSKNNCLKPAEKEIVYCLEVPIEEVIYFDGLKWDYVLNNLYIPKDNNDEKKFKTELMNLGLTDTYSLFEGKSGGKYPDLEKKIENSWERIFDITNWNEFIVQANLWHIKKEWIKHIIRSDENFFDITANMKDTFPPKL